MACSASAASRCDRLASELAEQRQQTTDQRRRAEEAEKTASWAEATAEQLCTELAIDRHTVEEQRSEIGRLTTENVTVTAQLEATCGQVSAAERAAGQLRAELDDARRTAGAAPGRRSARPHGERAYQGRPRKWK